MTALTHCAVTLFPAVPAACTSLVNLIVDTAVLAVEVRFGHKYGRLQQASDGMSMPDHSQHVNALFVPC